MIPTAEDRPTLTVPEAAAALGVSAASLYRALAAGDAPVPHLRVGSRILICTRDLRAVLGLDNLAPADEPEATIHELRAAP
ncbi:MAG: helix-turn-helix domain-containing protein [Acidimicrobiia bacterium]